jgi:hypothetical protein
MFFTSAVGLGMIVVFLVGAGVTYLAVGLIVNWRNRNPALNRDPLKSGGWALSEDDYTHFAVGGGAFAVVLLILSLVALSRQWFYTIWTVLTVLGILFGISTFFINGGMRPKGQPGARYRPPAPTGASPTGAAPTGAAPPAREDAYHDLLVRVKFDTGLAERLIEYERKRSPNASREDLCRRAIERLNRDNR